jgi:hypothetical protein
VATANNYAPTSLAGKTISANGGSGVFGNDGTFTYTKNGSSETGTYTYAQFSPVGGMVVVSHPASDSFSYVQVQFNSATSGSAYEVDYYLGNVDGFAVFNFTLK